MMPFGAVALVLTQPTLIRLLISSDRLRPIDDDNEGRFVRMDEVFEV